VAATRYFCGVREMVVSDVVACYGDASWETNAFEVASTSTATRFRERVVSSFLPCGDISDIFPGFEYTYSGRPACSPSRVPLRVLRDSSLCHTFRLPTLPGGKSLYRHLWERGSTMTPIRFHERIVARKSPPPSRRQYIFPRNKIDPHTWLEAGGEQLLSRCRTNSQLDRIAKLVLAFGIYQVNQRAAILTVTRTRNRAKCSRWINS